MSTNTKPRTTDHQRAYLDMAAALERAAKTPEARDYIAERVQFCREQAAREVEVARLRDEFGDPMDWKW